MDDERGAADETSRDLLKSIGASTQSPFASGRFYRPRGKLEETLTPIEAP